MFGIGIYKKYKEAIEKCKPIDAIVSEETHNILCPKCRAIAFTFEETPLWMTGGYCFRCGQLLKWQRSKED